jgi:hypothetical protein
VLYGSLAILWGYFSSVVKRAPWYGDVEFRRFLRRYQHLALVMGKARASRRIEAEQEPVWQARHGVAPVPGSPRGD